MNRKGAPYVEDRRESGEEVGKGKNATHVEEKRLHTASRAFAPKRALDSGLYSRV
jgi:hypothetical protein